MWFNPIMIWILKSPLHPLLSGNTLLVSWVGKKSGKTYTTPVNYQRQGQTLVTLSQRDRTWWRSLRSGTPVNLHLQGKTVQAVPQVLETDERVAPALLTYLQQDPSLAPYLKVGLDANKKPRPEDVALAAPQRVLVIFTPQ